MPHQLTIFGRSFVDNYRYHHDPSKTEEAQKGKGGMIHQKMEARKSHPTAGDEIPLEIVSPSFTELNF